MTTFERTLTYGLVFMLGMALFGMLFANSEFPITPSMRTDEQCQAMAWTELQNIIKTIKNQS